LSYAFTKKNKHKSRINVFGRYKSVINSPKVYFGIARQHAEVEHKNIIIFGYKNHPGRFCKKGNNF
jgi:hypothetical protein